jgi:hypothetical protein
MHQDKMSRGALILCVWPAALWPCLGRAARREIHKRDRRRQPQMRRAARPKLHLEKSLFTLWWRAGGSAIKAAALSLCVGTTEPIFWMQQAATLLQGRCFRNSYNTVYKKVIRGHPGECNCSERHRYRGGFS